MKTWQEIEAAALRVREQLRWSGDRGVLLEARLQTSADGQTTVTKFLSVNNLGSGSCPEQVLVQALSGLRDPHGAVITAPERGAKYDAKKSFYIWAKIEGKNSIRLSVVAPGWSAPLNAYAVGEAGKLWLSEEILRRDQERFLNSVAREAAARITDARGRARIHELNSAQLEAARARTAAYQQLALARERQRSAQEAQGVLTTLKGIVAVANLVDSVGAALKEQIPEVSKAMQEAVVTNSTAPLESALRDYSGNVNNDVQTTHTGTLIADGAVRSASGNFQAEVRKSGAPPEIYRDGRFDILP